jgi:hypothetical protein
MKGFRLWCGIAPGPSGIFRTIMAVALCGCGQNPATLEPDARSLSLIEWKQVEWGGSGAVSYSGETGILSIGTGTPMTLAKWDGELADLPMDNYEIRWEARRIDGEDFFCGLTFPVGSAEHCLTFIAGGWRGQVTGISNVNGYDAAENQTRVWVPFENGRWYQFRLEVTSAMIRAEVDGRQIIALHRPGKILEMRSGEMEWLKPLGFGTWRSSGQIREVTVRELKTLRLGE